MASIACKHKIIGNLHKISILHAAISVEFCCSPPYILYFYKTITKFTFEIVSRGGASKLCKPVSQWGRAQQRSRIGEASSGSCGLRSPFPARGSAVWWTPSSPYAVSSSSPSPTSPDVVLTRRSTAGDFHASHTTRRSALHHHQTLLLLDLNPKRWPPGNIPPQITPHPP